MKLMERVICSFFYYKEIDDTLFFFLITEEHQLNLYETPITLRELYPVNEEDFTIHLNPNQQVKTFFMYQNNF